MPHSGSPTVAWIGPPAGDELAWARRAAADLATVLDFADAGAVLAAPADGPWPALAFLASDVASRWTLADLIAISRRWPLTPLVSVAASLVEGRRRTGPPLHASEEVPWCELPARLRWWLADREAGRPGTLGLPATARREDRAVEAVAALRARGPGPPRPSSPWPIDRQAEGSAGRRSPHPAVTDGSDGPPGPPTRAGARVSVAAARASDLEGLADLVAASGRDVVRRSCGRPPLEETADVLVWDTGALAADHLAWLRLLVANRPKLAVVIIDSFPRAETTFLALQAGAAAVFGRPVSPESLAGALAARELGHR